MKRVDIVFLISFILTGTSMGANAQAPPVPAGQTCDAIPGYHRLDFWIGTWDVFDSKGAHAGRDHISKILKGCAVTEDWTDADGSRGLGLLYYNNVTNQWSKLYLTEQANIRGGIKERVLVGDYPNGAVRFQGVIPGPAGRPRVMNRTTISPINAGRVHYVIENSLDGGDSWITAYDVMYVKVADAAAAASSP